VEEKTLLDMIYYDYPFKDEIIPNLLDFVSPEELKRYFLIKLGGGRLGVLGGFRKNLRGSGLTTSKIGKLAE